MSDQEESVPLTRREMRLREMAARAAESEPNEQDANESAGEISSSLAEAIEEALREASIDVSPLDDEGQPRTRRELRELRAEAEATIIAKVTAEHEAAEAAASTEAAEQGAAAEELAEAEAAAQLAAAEATEEGEDVDDLEPAESDDDVSEAEHFETMHVEAELDQATEIEPTPDGFSEAPLEQEAAPSEEYEVEPDPAPATSGYSFPDIAPLDEGGSVFDDPALRLLSASDAAPDVDDSASGDFDDLISRAVAQESTGSANTSALILPNMPTAEGLTGPLGETGELFITGSFDLPKSLGETGGHSALHDSVEIGPLDELGFSEPNPTGSLMAPVSASRAVSMRSRQGPLVAEATKDKSKLPVVLIATGGALVIGAAALIIWAAASGMFG